PTDEDWHWWGKLNEDGCGVVIVLRGNAGESTRQINIPWAKTDKKYLLKSLFAGEELGEFSGKQLHDGKLKLQLPVWGQEIIEVKAKKN
ncbi:MAG: hypothetical protein LBB64_02990, partial [Dysgonamonadaceae bacterium]|nr:hypothetical protein [Dysgonamonadaceae bacterium]